MTTLLEQWDFYLATRQYVGGEFRIREGERHYRGPLASISVRGNRTTLRIQAVWLASSLGTEHGPWEYTRPTTGFTWEFPVAPPPISSTLMAITQFDEEGRVEFYVPGMGEYTVLPAGAEECLTEEQVRGSRPRR